MFLLLTSDQNLHLRAASASSAISPGRATQCLGAPLDLGSRRTDDMRRWTSTIAWQAGNAQGIFIVGSLIQTIILVNNENYAFPNWHGALLAIASMVFAYVCVVYGAKALPYWQNAVFAVRSKSRLPKESR
jgi:hypothetical protein